MNVDEWQSVLKLADMWTLDELKTKAVQQCNNLLQGTPAVNKITLGRRYKVADWMIDGYEALCRRREGLNATERAALGDDSAWKIVALREIAWISIMDQSFYYNSNSPYNLYSNYGFRQEIERVFWDELRDDAKYRQSHPQT